MCFSQDSPSCSSPAYIYAYTSYSPLYLSKVQQSSEPFEETGPSSSGVFEDRGSRRFGSPHHIHPPHPSPVRMDATQCNSSVLRTSITTRTTNYSVHVPSSAGVSIYAAGRQTHQPPADMSRNSNLPSDIGPPCPRGRPLASRATRREWQLALGKQTLRTLVLRITDVQTRATEAGRKRRR